MANIAHSDTTKQVESVTDYISLLFQYFFCLYTENRISCYKNTLGIGVWLLALSKHGKNPSCDSREYYRTLTM